MRQVPSLGALVPLVHLLPGVVGTEGLPAVRDYDGMTVRMPFWFSLYFSMCIQKSRSIRHTVMGCPLVVLSARSPERPCPGTSQPRRSHDYRGCLGAVQGAQTSFLRVSAPIWGATAIELLGWLSTEGEPGEC